MTVQFVSTVYILVELVKLSQESIAGVTYMDHFDFEERYRNVYECDPLYWHPLHLPEECVEMYEKLIRRGVASKFPVRVVKKKEKNKVYKMNPSLAETLFPTYNANYMLHDGGMEKQTKSPYEKMFSFILKDVMKDPSEPVLGIIPNFGLVTVYRQPVSKTGENKIKKFAETYADSIREAYPYAVEVVTSPDKTTNETVTNEGVTEETSTVMDSKEKLRSKIKKTFKRDKEVAVKRKVKKGNIVAIVKRH